MSTKIGFNNFKAFGSQMQYFTKKPITLVYGPNSVGKSSLIRAILFREYLKTTRSHDSEFTYKYEESNNFISTLFSKAEEGRNIKTNIFGDLYDIGNFESMIYKHDESQKINYDLTYTDGFPLFRSIAFSPFLNAGLSTRLGQIGHESLKIEFDHLKIILELKYFYKEQTDTSEATTLLETFFLKQLGIKKEALSIKTNFKILEQFIDFTYSQLLIKSIRIKTSVDRDLLQEHQFFVEDELLFTCKEIDYFGESRTFDVVLFTNNKVFEKVFFKPEGIILQEKYIFNKLELNYTKRNLHYLYGFFNLLSNYSSYIEIFLQHIIQQTFFLNEDNENIYIGPIRTIPSRKELYGHKNFYKKQSTQKSDEDTMKNISVLYVAIKRLLTSDSFISKKVSSCKRNKG